MELKTYLLFIKILGKRSIIFPCKVFRKRKKYIININFNLDLFFERILINNRGLGTYQ